MHWGNMKILLASTATAAVASQVAIKLYKILTAPKSKPDEIHAEELCNKSVKDQELNDVIFFSDLTSLRFSKVPSNNDLKVCESRELNCCKLIRYIKAARQTLDVCMYLITSNDIVEHIIKLGQKHVLIRILVDSNMAFTTESQVKRLQQYSFIQVQTSQKNALMHHKFCIVDGPMAVKRKNQLKAHAEKLNIFSKNAFYFCKKDFAKKKLKGFLMSGSLNWSTQAMVGNYENVVITSNENIVAKFEKEFARLWIEDDPVLVLAQ